MLYDWSMDSNHSTSVSFLNFLVAYFAKRNLNSGDFEKRAIRNPARIPPQTPPAGGKSAEAGRIHTPSQLFRPAESALVPLEKGSRKVYNYSTSSNLFGIKNMERFCGSQNRALIFAKTLSACGGSREIP